MLQYRYKFTHFNYLNNEINKIKLIEHENNKLLFLKKIISYLKNKKYYKYNKNKNKKLKKIQLIKKQKYMFFFYDNLMKDEKIKKEKDDKKKIKIYLNYLNYFVKYKNNLNNLNKFFIFYSILFINNQYNIFLPKKQTKFVTLKSSFVHKKAQKNFKLLRYNQFNIEWYNLLKIKYLQYLFNSYKFFNLFNLKKKIKLLLIFNNFLIDIFNISYNHKNFIKKNINFNFFKKIIYIN